MMPEKEFCLDISALIFFQDTRMVLQKTTDIEQRIVFDSRFPYLVVLPLCNSAT